MLVFFLNNYGNATNLVPEKDPGNEVAMLQFFMDNKIKVLLVELVMHHNSCLRYFCVHRFACLSFGSCLFVMK